MVKIPSFIDIANLEILHKVEVRGLGRTNGRVLGKATQARRKVRHLTDRVLKGQKVCVCLLLQDLLQKVMGISYGHKRDDEI